MSRNAGQTNGGQQQSPDLDPEVSIEVTSKDVLNLTLTRTCISLINELANVSRLNMLDVFGVSLTVVPLLYGRQQQSFVYNGD